MNDYIAALEHERQIRRMLGDRTSDKRMAEARAKTATAWKALATTAQRTEAASLAWLADPAEYDRRDAEADAAGTPIEERPRKFYWDIPAFPRAHYEIDVSWDFLEQNIAWFQKDYGLDLDPDFQRAHVWTVDQQRRYVEYQLQGGEVGSTLIFNHTAWETLDKDGRFTMVDGKQRMEAVRSFLRDDLVVFGRRRSQFTGGIRMTQGRFRFRVMSLQTDADVLRLYLSLNAGGTPHTQAELDKVRAMLGETK